MTDLRPIALLGPTASGKTELALALAEALPVEIISVDSALVYRDMNIGTAKPSGQELACCPHHLIDIISPEQNWSAADFCEQTIELIQQIRQRGRLPLLVGGTMLYFKALRDGLSDLPKADDALRQQIDSDAATLGWPAIHARLHTLDPEAAARFKPTDAQRIQRALEIVTLTGRPLAESYARKEMATQWGHMPTFALVPSQRNVLHERIQQRLDKMFSAGFIEEVVALRSRYKLHEGMPSVRCVGYRQVWSYLEGKDDDATMRYKALAATRQLAKRQLTWQRQFSEQWSDYHSVDCLDSKLRQNWIAAVKRLLGA